VKASGKAKSIGISNMQRDHIETILKVAEVVPAINQLEFHPYLQRANNLVPWMREQGIEVSSFKTLAPITAAEGGPLSGPLHKIAETHKVTADAVLLRWAMDQKVVPITTTSKAARLDQYLAALSLRLTAEEHERITQVGLTHHFRWWGKSSFDPDDRS
jgi:diketogulonate reductase-like aldo/keto reductase